MVEKHRSASYSRCFPLSHFLKILLIVEYKNPIGQFMNKNCQAKLMFELERENVLTGMACNSKNLYC